MLFLSFGFGYCVCVFLKNVVSRTLHDLYSQWSSPQAWLKLSQSVTVHFGMLTEFHMRVIILAILDISPSKSTKTILLLNISIYINHTTINDFVAAMLMSLSKGMAAMLVLPTNPLGIELYSYVNVFFCFG